MGASVSSPSDVLNVALRRIGYELRVGHLYDGSKAANHALDIYAQTRDAMLRTSDWGFAEKIAAGSSSGLPSPPAPWTVSYVYPSDCIRLRAIFGPAYLADKTNPLPNRFQIANDSTGTKVIFANLASASLVYTAQITDPSKWEPLFVEMLSVELGKRLAPVLTSAEGIKMMMEEEKFIVPLATETRG